MKHFIHAVKRPRAARVLASAAAAAVVLSAAGCSGASSDPKSSDGRGSVLRIAIPDVSAPANLDPAQGARTGPNIFFDLAYTPLIHLSQAGEFEPGLAESWGYTDDKNEVFELSLRPEAKFSDGTSVDSAAVKAYLEYFMQAGGPFSGAFGEGATVEAPSADKVVLRMKTPNPDVQWLLSQTNGAGFIASTAALKDKALTRDTYGAGQYVYDASQSVPGDTYTLTANDQFWDQSAIHYEKVVIKVVDSESSLVQGLASGQFDAGVGSIGTIKSAESSGLKVVSGQLSWDGASILNVAGATNAMSDVRVRQALNYAVDRETLVQGLLYGQGTPTSSWMTLDGADPESQSRYNYDPEKAKQLLADAGYPSGITFKLLTNAGALPSGVQTTQLVQAMASQMEKAGIKLETTFATGTEIFAEQGSGKYDATLTSFGMNAYGTYYPIFLAPTAPLNLGHVTFPEVEKLTREYLTADDPGALASQVTKYVTEQALELPLFIPKAVVFTTDKVENVGFPASEGGLGQAILPDPTEWH